LLRDDPADIRCLELLAEGARTIGTSEDRQERERRRDEAIERGLAASAKLVQLAPNEPAHRLREAELFFQLAQVRAKQGRAHEAIAILQASVKTQRELLAHQPDMLRERAHWLFALGVLAKLVREVDGGFDQADALLAAGEEIGEALLHSERSFVAVGRYDDPSTALAHILSLRYAPAHSRRRVGIPSAHNEAMLRRAIALVEPILATHSGQPVANAIRNDAQGALANLLESESRFEEAEALRRRNCQFAFQFIQVGPLEKWKSTITKIAERDSTTAARHITDLHSVGREFEAILKERIETAGTSAPSEHVVSTWIQLGRTYAVLDDSAARQTAFRRATDASLEIGLDRLSYATIAPIAEYLREQKDFRKALTFFSRLVELLRFDAAILVKRGSSHLALGNVDAALLDFNRALEFTPPGYWPSIKDWICRMFRSGMLALAEKSIEQSNGSPDDSQSLTRRNAAIRVYLAARADLEFAAIDASTDEEGNGRHARCLLYNNLAWFLATTGRPELRDPRRAVELAEKAVADAPNCHHIWSTLGVARYCNGDSAGAREALQKSIDLRSGGDSFDWFFLAMAHWQLDDKDQARQWYDKAVDWMDKNQPQNEELQRFHTEAAELLGIIPREAELRTEHSAAELRNEATK
jgi:tetratricopeptide (TPR) repeat protein